MRPLSTATRMPAAPPAAAYAPPSPNCAARAGFAANWAASAGLDATWAASAGLAAMPTGCSGTAACSKAKRGRSGKKQRGGHLGGCACWHDARQQSMAGRRQREPATAGGRPPCRGSRLNTFPQLSPAPHLALLLLLQLCHEAGLVLLLAGGARQPRRRQGERAGRHRKLRKRVARWLRHALQA